MSPHHTSHLVATAVQLMAALEQYEQDVERMVAGWLDLDLYREASNQVEKIRMYSAAVPEFSTQWVALLIAHGELVHCLWRSQAHLPQARAQQIAEALRKHAACIRRLQARCRHYIEPPPGPAPQAPSSQ